MSQSIDREPLDPPRPVGARREHLHGGLPGRGPEGALAHGDAVALRDIEGDEIGERLLLQRRVGADVSDEPFAAEKRLELGGSPFPGRIDSARANLLEELGDEIAAGVGVERRASATRSGRRADQDDQREGEAAAGVLQVGVMSLHQPVSLC